MGTSFLPSPSYICYSFSTRARGRFIPLHRHVNQALTLCEEEQQQHPNNQKLFHLDYVLYSMPAAGVAEAASENLVPPGVGTPANVSETTPAHLVEYSSVLYKTLLYCTPCRYSTLLRACLPFEEHVSTAANLPKE